MTVNFATSQGLKPGKEVLRRYETRDDRYNGLMGVRVKTLKVEGRIESPITSR